MDLILPGQSIRSGDHTLTPYDSLCVSNEIAEGEDEAVIDYSGGTVILMETRDR